MPRNPFDFKNDFRLRLMTKRVDYDKAVHYYFIDNGVAYVTCKVHGLYDIICRYCVPGYDILSDEFSNYLERITEHIPDKYPLVLEITGHRFSKEEQTRIEDAIWTQFELRMGYAQKKQQSILFRILWFAIFFILSMFVMFGKGGIQNEVVDEIMFVVFWFFGDRLIEYILLDERDVSARRMKMGQLLSMKVVFTEKYSDEDLTDNEAEAIRNEVLENVKSDEI